MNSTGEFIKILREVFALDSKWVDWFMRDVFIEDELRFVEADNHTASVMVVTPYSMDFHGQMVRCDYISCVATLPSQRGKGLMRTLMHETLTRAYTEGVPFACLIPASRPLYFIYNRLGFASVFYINEERYTSLHAFHEGKHQTAEPTYEIFRRLEDRRAGTIRHNERQFRQAVADMELSNGFTVAVTDGEKSEAMAFAQITHEIKVVDILSTDSDATEAVLAEVRKRGGEKPVIIMAQPTEESTILSARGMLRIINVQAALNAYAKGLPDLKFNLRVRDKFIPENNGYYSIKDGICTKASEKTKKVDLDVSVNVLAEILFSAPKIGNLFDLPTRRPFLSLMLD